MSGNNGTFQIERWKRGQVDGLIGYLSRYGSLLTASACVPMREGATGAEVSLCIGDENAGPTGGSREITMTADNAESFVKCLQQVIEMVRTQGDEYRDEMEAVARKVGYYEEDPARTRNISDLGTMKSLGQISLGGEYEPDGSDVFISTYTSVTGQEQTDRGVCLLLSTGRYEMFSLEGAKTLARELRAYVAFIEDETARDRDERIAQSIEAASHSPYEGSEETV